VALLTGVELDHREWLGDTRETIGREKAGIFRAGRPAILGSPRMPQSVLDVAAAIGAQVRRADRARLRGLPASALPDHHPLDNAAAVLTALDALSDRLPLAAEHIIRGLRTVKLPGRFQVQEGRPEWIFDVAHNPDAAAALAHSLAARPCAGRTFAVTGILGDKDIAGVVSPLLKWVHHWIVATLPGPRGLDAAALIQRCAGLTDTAGWSRAGTVPGACEQAARAAGPDDRIVVFGSFHTVGPALQWRGLQVDEPA
jgi:dihydrofolate synthase/folylpolyglutamate synthase